MGALQPDESRSYPVGTTHTLHVNWEGLGQVRQNKNYYAPFFNVRRDPSSGHVDIRNEYAEEGVDPGVKPGLRQHIERAMQHHQDWLDQKEQGKQMDIFSRLYSQATSDNTGAEMEGMPEPAMGETLPDKQAPNEAPNSMMPVMPGMENPALTTKPRQMPGGAQPGPEMDPMGTMNQGAGPMGVNMGVPAMPNMGQGGATGGPPAATARLRAKAAVIADDVLAFNPDLPRQHALRLGYEAALLIDASEATGFDLPGEGTKGMDKALGEEDQSKAQTSAGPGGGPGPNIGNVGDMMGPAAEQGAGAAAEVAEVAPLLALARRVR